MPGRFGHEKTPAFRPEHCCHSSFFGSSSRGVSASARLRLAAELLRSTDLKVMDIARLTAFEGNKHFYGLFQAQFGVTPVQYHEGFFGRKELAE